jgi:hypothetical protein
MLLSSPTAYTSYLALSEQHRKFIGRKMGYGHSTGEIEEISAPAHMFPVWQSLTYKTAAQRIC